MEELDEARYSVMPSRSELAVEIVNGSFAWDALNDDRTSRVDRVRAAACRRKTAARSRPKVKPRRRQDNDDENDANDVRPDPLSLLYQAVFSRDDSPDVLSAINFTVTKASPAITT